MEFSRRMEAFAPGIFSVLAGMKRQRLESGRDVIDLSVGAPDLPPAPHIIEALCRSAADEGNYVYALGDTPELLAAAAAWYKRRYGVELESGEITSLLGSQDGLAHLALTLVNPGDLVLVPDPCYPVFADGPRLAGAELYRMPLRRERNFVIDLRDIPASAARRAKLMVVSYPNNPTCGIAPPEFYRELVAFAKEYDIAVLHDNAYSELVFDGRHCGSFLQVPGARDVGVEFNSLSKTYALAGARIGFALGNREMVGALRTLKSNLDYGMFLPVQKAAAAALTGEQGCVESTRRAYERRRDVLVGGLCTAGWPIEKPPATMFVWAPLPAGFADSAGFTRALLEASGVLVTPGAAFGPAGEGFVRLALVQNEETLARAARQVAACGLLHR